jgi:hypothetical protein
MTGEFVKTKKCDGACCRSAPRFPNKDNTNCIYSIAVTDKVEGYCSLIGELAEYPAGQCPALPNMTAEEAVKVSCIYWPHNDPGCDPGDDCCWEWVDGD